MKVSEAVKRNFYWLTASLATMLYVATGQFADPDLWGRLSIGALYFQNGQFPYYDVFSYTAPQARWIDHEWLTGIVFYQILTYFGELGFVLFKAGMILGIFYLLFRLHHQCYRVSPLFAFYGLLIAIEAFSMGLLATIRSQIFSFFFFVFFIYWLERERLGLMSKRWLWALVPVSVFWGNVHGGFIMGVLLLGCYGLAKSWQARSLKAAGFHWMLALLIFPALAMFNPYGADYLSYLFHAWTLDRSRISEWSPMHFESWLFLSGQCLIVGSAILILLNWLRVYRNGSLKPDNLLIASMVLLWLSAMCLKALRFQPFLALGVVAYTPLILTPDFMTWLLPQRMIRIFKDGRSVFQNTLPALLLISVMVGMGYLHSTINLLRVTVGDEMTQGANIQIRYPLGALRYLETSPYHGNLMVQFGFGEFVYWRMYPRFKVSLDGRYEAVYTQAEFLQNGALYDRKYPMQTQKAALNVHQSKADFILIDANMPNVGILMQSKHWKRIYGDPYFLVFGRKSTISQYPPYKPEHLFLTDKILSIADMVRPTDLQRFKN